MKKVLYIFMLVLSGATALSAEGKALQVGFAYTIERGGLAQFSAFAAKGILRFGGYGDFLVTNDSYLGGGGVQAGIGCDAFDVLQFTLLGKAGLGGGKIENESGACELYEPRVKVSFQVADEKKTE